MSDSSARSHPYETATRWWVERLERFSAGPHTVVAFCAAEGVGDKPTTEQLLDWLPIAGS